MNSKGLIRLIVQRYRPLRGCHSHPQYGLTNLLIRRDQNALALKQLGKFSILVHGHQDITPSDELFVQVQLWDGRPIRVFLDT